MPNNVKVIPYAIVVLVALFPFSAFALEKNSLGWFSTDNPYNRCGGYYMDFFESKPKASSIRTSQTSIMAKKSTLFSHTGVSILEGAVKFSQPGRQITSKKASLVRDSKSGAIKNIQLEGDVRVAEIGELLLSEKIDIDLAKSYMRLENVLYRINKTLKGGIQGSAWGQADFLEKKEGNVFNFSNATYSTCSPLNRLWHLKSKRLQLNPQTGRGSAFHSLFYIGHQPIFYFPFFEFPIDSRRKSGFLLPIFNYSNQGGWDITLPFYWNKAPNKDAIFSPRFIARRGPMLSVTPRYLDTNTNASASINFLLADHLFYDFQQSSIKNFAATPSVAHGLSRLESASNHRLIIGLSEQTTLDTHWSASLL